MKASPWDIEISRITEDGLDFAPELGEAWFRHWQEEVPGLEFTGPGAIHGAVHLEEHGREILLRGHLEGTLPLSCSRCLEAYDAPVAADFDILLEPAPNPRSRKRSSPPRNWMLIFIREMSLIWRNTSGNRFS